MTIRTHLTGQTNDLVNSKDVVFISINNDWATMKKYIKFFGILSLLILTVISNPLKAQVIIEGFEEAAWPTTNTNAQSASTVTISSYITTNTSNNATFNTGVWFFSNGYFVTTNGFTASSTATNVSPFSTATTVSSFKTYTVNSGTYAYHLTSSSNSYIVTPILGAGVTAVTIWARGNSTTANLAVYAASNTSLTSAGSNLVNITKYTPSILTAI